MKKYLCPDCKTVIVPSTAEFSLGMAPFYYCEKCKAIIENPIEEKIKIWRSIEEPDEVSMDVWKRPHHGPFPE